MAEIVGLNNRYPPAEIAQKVPWDRIKTCIVIHEIPDGDGVSIHISGMHRKDRLWLAGELQNYLMAECVSDWQRG